jgi:C-methyltransferase C-terminal domain/Putative zinc binding domain
MAAAQVRRREAIEYSGATMTTVHSCRSCHSETVELVLDLGEVPGSDVFPPLDSPSPDPRWALELYMCRTCALVQLGSVGPAAIDEQGAVESATAKEHALHAVRSIMREESLRPGDTVIEIDSGHGGSWLPGFVEAGLTPRGLDSMADLVVDLHGLMHETDLNAAVAAHADRIAPGGRLICEFYYLGALVEDSLIDTIRHGHYSYLSLISAMHTFSRHGLVVSRAQRVPTFGGSLRLVVRRAQDDAYTDTSVLELERAERAAKLDDVSALIALEKRGHAAASAFKAVLVSAAETGTSVAGYGAPSKAAVLMALAGVDATLLPYTVDMAPAKSGCRIPGANVPIWPVQQLIDDKPDVVVVLTWDIAAEVITNLRRLAADRNWDPRFWAPLPKPGYITV